MGLGDSYALNGQVRVSDAEAREHQQTLFAKRVTDIPNDLQQYCDYVARTDGQPVYIAYGPRGLAQSVTGWVIHKFTYNADGSLASRQTAFDSYNNRATATYA